MDLGEYRAMALGQKKTTLASGFQSNIMNKLYASATGCTETKDLPFLPFLKVTVPSIRANKV